jgi:hypothetical protein
MKERCMSTDGINQRGKKKKRGGAEWKGRD